MLIKQNSKLVCIGGDICNIGYACDACPYNTEQSKDLNTSTDI